MNTKPKITVKVISDVICPWCLIRVRQLQAAIKKMEKQCDVEYFMAPYMLNSKIPEEGMGFIEYFKTMDYGTYNMDQIEDIYKDAVNLAKQWQINMLTPKQIKLYRNTNKCHRIAEYVKAKYGNEKQTKVYEQFQISYLEKGEDVNNNQIIASCAGRAGLNEKEILDFLNNPASKPIKEEIEKTCIGNEKNYQVPSIPYFIVNEEYKFSAESPDTFTKVFEEIIQKSKK